MFSHFPGLVTEKWMPMLRVVGISLLFHGLVQAGVYTGPTDPATFTSLLSQVQAKSEALAAKVAEANLAGKNTAYAQTSQTTIKLFKDTYAPWDRANQSAVEAKYASNTWISQHDPVGPVGLPFDELTDCIELADAAIAELQQQIDGTITLQSPPNFATGNVLLNGTHYSQNGKTVIPSSFFWQPFDEDIMQAYGRSGSGYYAVTDMNSSNQVITNKKTSLQNLMSTQSTANRVPVQMFLGHVVGSTGWQRTANPDAFSSQAKASSSG